MKSKVINIEPWTVDASNFENEFVLQFIGTASKKSKLDRIIKIHMPRWYIKLIAEELWKIIKEEQSELSQIENSMMDSK